ncbi:MAG: glycosyltransferase family 4 protein [Prevotella sp.]|nr:glycosyltransferase family 4 protein [Prevotella sp.]
MGKCKKTTVAFFFDNGGRPDCDCRCLTDGNPGISGTAYMFYMMAWKLSARDNDIDVVLYTTNAGLYPNEVTNVVVKDFSEAWNRCEENKIDFIVIKHSEVYLNQILERKEHSSVKFIVWCHNFVGRKELSLYAGCDAVERLITVGREQMDVYRDHKAFSKTDYIYNCVSVPDRYKVGSRPYSERESVVTYMGCVIQSKGFHLLAKAWPKIIKAVPDARLNVIGNGFLYSGGDKNKKNAGEFGLADKKYESLFAKYITDDAGNLLPSVSLLGILGNEKYDILGQTKIGVPNPSGRTETFCISAVEMQMLGAKIVSKRCAGYLDTVKSGVLVKDSDELADAIIKELRCNHIENGIREYMEETFSPDVIVAEWEQLLTYCIPNGMKLHPESELVNPHFELKRYKESLRMLKNRHPILFKIVPAMDTFIDFWKTVRFFFWKKKVRFLGF